MTGTAALNCSIRSKSFGDTEILTDVAFTLKAGGRLALTGPSGIGKSTVLRILCGLDTDFTGEIQAPEKISLVFQEPTLLPWLTALDNLTIVTGADDAAAKAALGDVGLSGRETSYPRQLSLGQQRRLALARALAARPALLALDEPFASLDEATAKDMIDLTKALVTRDNVTTLLVTHSIGEAEALCDRRLVLNGNPATLRES